MLPDLLSAHLNLSATLAWMGGFVVGTPVIALVLPALLLAAWCFDATAFSYVVSSVATVAIILCSLTRSDYDNVFRYSQPILLTGLMVAVLAVLGPSGAHRTPSHRRLALALVLALWMPWLAMGAATRIVMVGAVPQQIGETGTMVPEAEVRFYKQLQASVPPSAPVLTVLHFPWLLDYKRQPIYNIDLMGLCSPAPGIPVFHGPQALKTYLQSLGIRYIAAHDFDNPTYLFAEEYPEYSRSLWLSRRYRWEREQRRMVPVYLDVMSSIDQLEKSEEVVFRTPNARVIRLR
jgi:hypothetical protein